MGYVSLQEGNSLKVKPLAGDPSFAWQPQKKKHQGREEFEKAAGLVLLVVLCWKRWG